MFVLVLFTNNKYIHFSTSRYDITLASVCINCFIAHQSNTKYKGVVPTISKYDTTFVTSQQRHIGIYIHV